MQQAFDDKARAWLQYNESARGQLRHAVTLHHLRAHAPPAPLDILDVGGGTGELSAVLARAGHALTLLDLSPAMVAEARRQCAGLNVRLVCADASQIPDLFEAGCFDLAVCHSLLAFVDDPPALLARLARVVRAGGLLSLVVGNRFHPPLRAALLERDFRRAQAGLDGEMPATDLFGLPRRTFCPVDVRRMVRACGMRVVGEYGVRVFADLLGGTCDLTQDLLDLELAAGDRMPYRHLARFLQYIAIKE
jgi:S-adenosylmethionine-dependent methyltransferase